MGNLDESPVVSFFDLVCGKSCWILIFIDISRDECTKRTLLQIAVSVDVIRIAVSILQCYHLRNLPFP